MLYQGIIVILVALICMSSFYLGRLHGNKSMDISESTVNKGNMNPSMYTNLLEAATNPPLPTVQDPVSKDAAAADTVSSSNVSGMDTEKAFQLVTTMYSRLLVTLNWIANQSPSSPVLKWNKISNSEVHIMHKLAQFMKQSVNNIKSNIDNKPTNTEALEHLTKLMMEGYKCDAEETVHQEAISKTIKMDICSEIEWYKVVQLAWPEASIMVDVGANKGYLGSLFLGLWGGSSHYDNLSPLTLFELSTKLKVWEGSRNPAGYCRDGYNDAIVMYCNPELRDQSTGSCKEKKEHIKIFSFDGSSYLTKTMNDIIHTNFKKAEAAWQYFNYAMSDRIGSVRFTKQGKGNNAGFEGGSIQEGDRGNQQTSEEVNMTTVDIFLGSKGVTRLDILKIDAEGNDNKVIFGSSKYIKSTVGLLTFEAGKGTTFTSSMINEMDSIGYSCYSTSRAGLFKLNGGCMNSKFIDSKWDKGNVFCTSRTRVPLVSLAFDILSFPYLVLSNPPKGDDYVRSYVNIKPFCSPWPKCVAVI